MRHGSTPDAAVSGRRRHSPELPAAYSGESDPVQRLLAFAYLQAQKGQREASEELRKDADILSAVLAAQSQIAAAHFDLEQSLEFLAEGARRLTGAGGAAIALRVGRTVVCRGRSGLIAPDLAARLNPDSGISGECLTSGEVQLCDDTEHDPRVDVWVCRNLGIRSILAVPLRRQQDVLGIIVAFSGWAGVFGERDIRALKLLASLVIEALWSHEVHRRETPAPAPEQKVEASTLVEDVSAELEQILESMPKPAALEPQAAIAEVPVPIETPTAAEAELPAAAFTALAGAEPRRRGRALAIIVAAIVVLATGALLWRDFGELLHHRPAAVAPSTAAPALGVVTTTPAPTATPAPETASPTPSAQPATNTPAEVSEHPAPAASPSQLLAIRSWSKPEGTTIALFLQAPVRWESGVAKEPERIYFDLQNTQLAPEMLGKSREGLAIPVDDGLVNRVRVAQRESAGARVVIDLATPAEYSAVLSPTEPYRLMIVVRKVQAPNNPPPNLEPAPSKKPPIAAPSTPAPHAALGRHPKIVIDPGHGGTEDGAIGHGGLKEKELTLEISKRLGNLLAHRLGAEVIYTRTSDVTVALDERAAIANQAGADLFVSIHANSSDDPGARGVETFYVTRSYAPSNPLQTAATAPSENAPKAGALKPAADDPKVSESRKLAADVQQALYHAFGGEKGVLNRGVKQAPFVVLLDAEMPSILAEVAFVTSPADEHKLSTAEGQQAVADALYHGIVRYLTTAKRGKVVASLSGQQGN